MARILRLTKYTSDANRGDGLALALRAKDVKRVDLDPDLCTRLWLKGGTTQLVDESFEDVVDALAGRTPPAGEQPSAPPTLAEAVRGTLLALLPADAWVTVQDVIVPLADHGDTGLVATATTEVELRDDQKLDLARAVTATIARRLPDLAPAEAERWEALTVRFRVRSS